MNRRTIALVAVCVAVVIILATVLVSSGILGTNSVKRAEVAKLDLALPDGLSVSSFATFGNTLVLCCWNESLYGRGLPAFSLLTYRSGDSSFSIHNIAVTPYEGLRTSLQVLNGKLFLFHTEARGGEYTSYRSYLQEVHTNDWTLGESIWLNLPGLLAPGVQVSDGESLYIIGGRTSNTVPPYWPTFANDTAFKVDVATGDAQTVAEVPGAAYMRCLYLDGNFVMLHRAGDWPGGAETNYGSSIDYSLTTMYNPVNRSGWTPGGFVSPPLWGSLPASDGTAAYFFNPWAFNSTSAQWNGTHGVWKMDRNGVVTTVNITLPEELQYVVPMRLGGGFVLMNESPEGTTFWMCTL